MFIHVSWAPRLSLVWLWYKSLAQTVATVADTGGDAYQRAIGPTAGAGTMAGFQQEIWYARGVNGGAAFTVTATFTSQGNFERSISAHEYSGASVTGPVDVVTTTAATGNVNVASGSVMSNAGKLIFGAALFSAQEHPVPDSHKGPRCNLTLLRINRLWCRVWQKPILRS